MSMRIDFNKINNLLQRNNRLFEFSVKKQKDFLDHIKEPENDMERSYCQYRCQMKLSGWRLTVVRNFLSGFLIPYYYLKPNKKGGTESADIVFMANRNSDRIIPPSLKSTHKIWKRVECYGENLDHFDRAFFRKVARQYPFSFYFLLKILIKLRYFSYEVQVCGPQAIVSCEEFSFTSSVITSYCNYKCVQHINVMHGEKLYYIRDSFFRFDKCYVWDKHYVDLFCALRADSSQFVVELPEMMRGTDTEQEKTVDFTYYLGNEDEIILKKIAELLRQIKENGFKVVIRPHPVYTTYEKVKSVISDIEIEENIDIDASIFRSKYAVARYSTVLNRAYYNNVSVVIDDVSCEDEYLKLKELQYIMLSKKHLLLSNCIKRKNSIL